MTEYELNKGGNIQNEIGPQSKMNFFQRVAGIIVSPAKTLQDLIAKPRILFPFLSSAFGLLVLYLARFELYKDYLRETLERAAAVDPSITAEQIEALIGITTSMGLFTTPLTTIIVWLVSAAILFGAVKLFKGEGRFKQYLSIVGYCGVITLLYYVICIAVSFFSGALMLDASLANITNLFVPYIKGTFIYGVFRSIGFFNIWYYILIAIGVTLLSKLPKSKVYPIVTAVFIIEMLVNTIEYRYL